MSKYRYKGAVSPVSVKGRGLVKRGDVVDFSENEISGLSKENWELESENVFNNKSTNFPRKTGKKVFHKKKKKEE